MAKLMINCTQLDENYSAKDKKRILQEWCSFLVEHPDTFTELMFCTRMPQNLFDAVCTQRKLKKLHIKWGVYPDISKLENLQELEYLHIGSGRSVSSLEPISKLEKLVALSNLEHLTLKSCKEVKQLYPQFVKLPKLKYGTVLERPELYEN